MMDKVISVYNKAKHDSLPSVFLFFWDVLLLDLLIYMYTLYPALTHVLQQPFPEIVFAASRRHEQMLTG